MKKINLIFVVFLSFSTFIIPQIVKGRIIDEGSNPLSQVQLRLFTTEYIYTTFSSANGSFSFNMTTDVEDENLPSGYSVSEFYPNPFNPKTRVAITLPGSEVVKIEVFNTLGEKVKETSEKVYNAGTSYLDIELSGAPNGVYVSRITIGEKYTVVKKLMLLYGSQHLMTKLPAICPDFTKKFNNTLNIYFDSLVASSGLMWKKTFLNLPVYTGDTLDLGDLIIERFCPGNQYMEYEGKTYNTVQIGNQCWLKENLNVGVFVNSTYADSTHTDVSDNGIIERYCYDNNPVNCFTYGGLYDWNEAMAYSTTPGAQGICPTGWHILTYDEYETLRVAVNCDGNALKSIGQGIGIAGLGTNTSGFSALLTGHRNSYGYFYYLDNFHIFWTSIEGGGGDAFGIHLDDYDNFIFFDHTDRYYGFNVRCLRDY